MIVGRVVGAVTSTIQHPFYAGKKLLMVRKLDAEGKEADGFLVAVARAAPGAGDPVLVLDEGTGARQGLEPKDGPVRSVIVGVVDAIEKAP